MAVFAFTAWLGHLDLNDPDEARHAEIAREMLASGQWLTPRVEGLPYHDKPPLVHWLVAASMAAFGEQAGAARLPSAAAALWTLVMTAWWVARAYSPAVARLAVLGLSTTFVFVAVGRTVVVDMPFAAALTTGFAWLGVAWTCPDPRNLTPFYVAIGIATLIKGPAAIALACLLVTALAIIDRAQLRRIGLRPVRGLLIVAAVAAPWYLAAWMSEPGYVETFLWKHNVLRYLSQLRTHPAEPWFYYLVALPAALLPWTPLVAAAACAFLRSSERRRADAYAMVWAGTVIGFFLPAGTRLITYLLPAFPALAALAATYVHKRMLADPAARCPGWLGAYAAASLTILAAAALGVLGLALVAGRAGAADVAATVAVACLPPLAIAAARRRESARILVALAGCSLAVVAVTYTTVAKLLNAGHSLRPTAEIVRRDLPASALLVTYGVPAHALSFYSGRMARRTKDPAEAATALAGSAPAALLTRERYLAELAAAVQTHAHAPAWWPARSHPAGDGRVLVLNDAAARTQVAEKGGSRTLRRPSRPTSRF